MCFEISAMEPTQKLSHTVKLLRQALQFEAAPELTILQAAQNAGITMLSSCRNGSCRTCLCRLQKGEVVYSIEWPGLSFDEKQASYILPCVAMPRSDLEIESDQFLVVASNSTAP